MVIFDNVRTSEYIVFSLKKLPFLKFAMTLAIVCTQHYTNCTETQRYSYEHSEIMIIECQ